MEEEKSGTAWHQWLTPVNLATQEADMTAWTHLQPFILSLHVWEGSQAGLLGQALLTHNIDHEEKASVACDRRWEEVGLFPLNCQNMKHTFSVISAIPGSQGNASTVEFKNISYGITVWAHHLTEMREEHNL
jgi:hypothetical protein